MQFRNKMLQETLNPTPIAKRWRRTNIVNLWTTELKRLKVSLRTFLNHFHIIFLYQ